MEGYKGKNVKGKEVKKKDKRVKEKDPDEDVMGLFNCLFFVILYFIIIIIIDWNQNYPWNAHSNKYTEWVNCTHGSIEAWRLGQDS